MSDPKTTADRGMSAEDACSIAEVSKYCMATDLGLECVCSRRSSVKVGTGATSKSQDSTLFYYARQVDDDLLALQSLNANWAPSGPSVEVTMEELITQYQPEVDMFLKKVKPAMQKIAKHVARGDRHRNNGEPYSAAMEYSNALGLDEKNVRAMFGLGLTYLQYDQHEKARALFEDLIGLEGFVSAEFKHLFNQFGIELRRQKMNEQARRYYARAIELCTTDENLFFNLARAFFEDGRIGEADRTLETCLRINPVHEEAIRFKKYLSSVCLS